MATPPNPRIYLADDFSWGQIPGVTPSTAFQNFYSWDGHGGIGQNGYGTGASRGWGFVGESSSGVIGWTIIDLDTKASLANATMATCFGHNMGGTATGFTDPICRFREAVGGPTHVYLNTDGTNHIRAYNGNGTLLGTTDGVTGGTGMPEYRLPASAPDKSGPTTHLEVKVKVDAAVGTVQVWAADIAVMNLSGKNTQNGGSGVTGYIDLWMSGARISCEWFVHDGSARLGSQWRVGYVPVASAGTYTSGTASSGTNVSCVDDLPGEAEATTYVSLDDTGLPKKVSFVSGPMPASALQIRDVFPQMVVEKSDGGTNTGRVGLKSAATEIYNTNIEAVPDAWGARRLALRTDPASGTPLWTLATAAAAEVIVDRET